MVTLNGMNELMTVPFVFSMQTILIHWVLDMPVAEVDSGITNMGFTIAPGLAREFSPAHSYMLSISANFAMTLPVSDFNASYSFQTVMVPVPGQNLEICSASTCNTRQKERKLGFYKRKVK